MRKDITPEMYNYNKFPGPDFISFDNHVKSDDIDLLILENVKDAFDSTVFGQRFSEILLKYDYIVGDWGNEQLRLKGFYKQADKKKALTGISRLDDYLREYCNFGCAYFVLENPNPREFKSQEERPQKRRRRDNRKRRPVNNNKQSKNNHQVKQERSRQDKPSQQTNQHFVIRKKESK